MSFAKTDEHVIYGNIYDAVNGSLGNERSKRIEPWMTLGNLGVDALDFADICFRLHIPFQDYFSAGAYDLTDKGKNCLVQTRIKC